MSVDVRHTLGNLKVQAKAAPIAWTILGLGLGLTVAGLVAVIVG